MTEIETQTLKEAKKHVGEHEQGGSNRGPFVAKCLMFVRCALGQPWCASFACFMIHEAAKQLGITAKFPKTPSTSAIARWAKANGRMLNEPRPGCVGLVKGNAYKTGYEHTYLVHPWPDGSVVKNGKLLTIEGNLGNAVRWNKERSPEGSDFAEIV